MKSISITLSLITCLIVLSSNVSAKGVFKWVDAQGKTQYGDSPPADKKDSNFEMPAITVIDNYANQWKPLVFDTGTKKVTPVKTVAKKKQQLVKYTTIKFLAPKSGQVIRANDGDVSAMLKIQPKLKADHQVVFLLDGNEVSKNRSRTSNFSNLSRGAHTAVVKVVDRKGNIIGSDSVSFEVQRHSALFKKKPQ
ncbi:MAG: DUF4124 domain-containing protein [Cocleimonas sp.]